MMSLPRSFTTWTRSTYCVTTVVVTSAGGGGLRGGQLRGLAFGVPGGCDAALAVLATADGGHGDNADQAQQLPGQLADEVDGGAHCLSPALAAVAAMLPYLSERNFEAVTAPATQER